MPGSWLSELIDRAPAETVPLGMLREDARHMLEKLRRIPAIVVGKCDDVGAEVLERDVACPTESRLRAEAEDREDSFEAREDRSKPLVGVLVDDDYPEIAVGLRMEST